MINMLIRANIYSEFMQPARMEKANFRRMIEHPTVYAAKECVPVALYGTMVDNPFLNDSGQVRPLGANVKELSCIQLDYDDGKSIDDFIREFSGKFRFCLYTSYSYGFKGPYDRFRVIIPLAAPLKCADMNQYFTKALDSIFHCDISCHSKGHMQCVPAIRSQDAPYRYYFSESGPYFSIPWNLVENEKEKAIAEYAFGVALNSWYERCDKLLGKTRKEPDPEAMREAALNWAQNQFDKCVEGQRNNTMFSVLSWLRSKGIPAEDAFMLSPPAGIGDDEYDRMLKRIFYGA